MPFQFEAPPSRLTASIADMIARGGSSQAQAIRQIAEAQAQAAQIRGRALGGAIENIGQVVGSIPAQMQQQKIQDQNTQIRQAQLDQVAKTGANEKALTSALQSPSRAKALKSLEGNPEAYQRAVTHYGNIDTNMKRLLGSVAAGVREFGDSPEAALAGLSDLVEQGFDAQKLNQYRMRIIEHPEAVSQIVDGLLSNSPDEAHQKLVRPAPKPAEPYTLNRGDVRFGPNNTKIAENPAEPPKPPAPPNVGSFEDYVTRKYGAQPTPDQIEAARKAYGDAGRVSVSVGGEENDNVKAAVAGMKAGRLPPLLPGRASKDYIALMAEAERQGFDLAEAATDWVATQKHISSMNSTQQLRLNQSINQLPELLDSVDALAAKWKGGRFPLLNKANLAAAKNGVYGDEVASIARQLDTQIADVTADLGNVYMGGNSPTDHALKLAGTALSGDWSEKVLTDMTKLARQNVKTRLNSIKNTGVQGASEDNPYAPPQVNATWIRDANGKLVKQ